MKTVLQWFIIIFTVTSCLDENRGTVIYADSSCTNHAHCPDNRACISGNCGDPCESLCAENTYCTTFQHIPACACKKGYTGNPFIRCNSQGAVSAPVAGAGKPVKSSKGCKIPNDSPDIKYCSLGEGCSACDYSNTRCHLAPGTEVDEGVQVKEVCASDPVSQISTATCYSKGWNPPFPKCQYRCGVSKAVNSTAVTIAERLPAYPGYFPWHAGIYTSSKNKNGSTTWIYHCGGVLITDQYVLTAYYCVVYSELTKIQVTLGKHHEALEKEEPTAEIRSVTEVSLSPTQFTHNSSFRYEVALLKLNLRVKFNEYIRPVCLYYGDDTNKLRNSNLYIVGLGDEKQRPDKDILDYKTGTLMSENECRKAIKEKNKLFQEVFCIHNPGLGRPGDAGSGLTAVDEDGLHYLIGYDIYKLYYNGGVNLYGNTLFGKSIEWMKSKINPTI